MPDSVRSLSQDQAPPGEAAAGLIAGRYRVDLENPLPHLDTAGGKAYAVTDQRDSAARLYAIVQDPGMPQRKEAVESLLATPATNILNPLAQETLIPGRGQPERLITLFEAPGGPSLADPKAGLPVNGHRLRKHLVPGLLKALRALHDRRICHRAIHPGNVFFTNETLDEIVLGDCVSAPPGADQPAYCEPLERAAAEPHGRGEGEQESDLFAVGATLLTAHLGSMPGGGRNAEKLHAARVAQGSFWALSGGAEIPGIVGSLMRGLLNDDPGERWTLSEIAAWLESAMPSRRSVNTLWTFARPVTFRRETYSDRRLLARDLAQHPLEAAAFLRSLDFSSWVPNMITTELFSERLERLLAVQPEADLSSSRHGDHAMVARVCAHFDPQGPVRFRSLLVCIDGIGPALAQAYRAGDETRQAQFEDLFAGNVLPSILEIVAERNPTVQRMIYALSEAGKQVRKKTPGSGLTRALYDLNESLPCLSEQFRDRWIETPEGLLQALDARAGGASELSSLLDAHVLAFFASRVEGAQRYVEQLGTGGSDRVRRMATVIDLLAFLQSKLKAGKLTNLCEQLAKALRGLVKELHSKTRREAALETLEQLGRKGDIRQLANALDFAHLIERDSREFTAARRQLADIAHKRRQLSRPVKPDDPTARVAGYRLSAALGGLVLLGTAAFMALMG